MGLLDLSLDMISEGINIVLDSATETTMEVTTAWLAQELNKIKWAGKSNWTSKIIESYIDNLRSNLQSSITANIINRRINKLQNNNYGYYAMEKVRSRMQSFRGGQ